MIEIWQGPRKSFGLREDMGMGCSNWDHWATLIETTSGKRLRIELFDMTAKVSRCGKWKRLVRFNRDVKPTKEGRSE